MATLDCTGGDPRGGGVGGFGRDTLADAADAVPIVSLLDVGGCGAGSGGEGLARGSIALKIGAGDGGGPSFTSAASVASDSVASSALAAIEGTDSSTSIGAGTGAAGVGSAS